MRSGESLVRAAKPGRTPRTLRELRGRTARSRLGTCGWLAWLALVCCSATYRPVAVGLEAITELTSAIRIAATSRINAARLASIRTVNASMTGVGVVDMDRHEAVFVIVGVEQRQLLMADLILAGWTNARPDG
jgi:hypothetical protein